MDEFLGWAGFFIGLIGVSLIIVFSPTSEVIKSSAIFLVFLGLTWIYIKTRVIKRIVPLESKLEDEE